MSKTNTKGLTPKALKQLFFKTAYGSAGGCCLFDRPALDELYRRVSESGVVLFTDNASVGSLIQASLDGWVALLRATPCFDPFTPARAILFLETLHSQDFFEETFTPRVY